MESGYSEPRKARLTQCRKVCFTVVVDANNLIDELGGTTAVAALCFVTKQAVSQWRVRGIPEDYCPTIEKVTSGSVTCEELRPDIYWIRIKDRAWPHPKGRPLVDHAASIEART